jgi:hypothetical protein
MPGAALLLLISHMPPFVGFEPRGSSWFPIEGQLPLGISIGAGMASSGL